MVSIQQVRENEKIRGACYRRENAVIGLVHRLCMRLTLKCMRVTLKRQLEMQAVGDETRGWGIVIQGDSILVLKIFIVS
jgi:hypothetical protein